MVVEVPGSTGGRVAELVVLLEVVLDEVVVDEVVVDEVVVDEVGTLVPVATGGAVTVTVPPGTG